jgi:hypothetical protein
VWVGVCVCVCVRVCVYVWKGPMVDFKTVAKVNYTMFLIFFLPSH